MYKNKSCRLFVFYLTNFQHVESIRCLHVGVYLCVLSVYVDIAAYVYIKVNDNSFNIKR